MSVLQPAISAPSVKNNYEKIEDRFHRLRREGDINGLRQLAKEDPEVYGIAVEEHINGLLRRTQLQAQTT